MITVGKFIVAHRKDGRIFCGEVVQSRAVNGDGLIIVRFDFKGSVQHRSFYLRDLESWTVSDDAAAVA